MHVVRNYASEGTNISGEGSFATIGQSNCTDSLNNFSCGPAKVTCNVTEKEDTCEGWWDVRDVSGCTVVRNESCPET